MILGVNQHNIVVFEFGSLIGRCLNSVFKIAVFLQCFRKLILAERLDIKELIFARKFEEKQRCRFIRWRIQREDAVCGRCQIIQ